MFENKTKLIVAASILVIAAIVFYLVWGIYLNKGTVVFKYERLPYTVTIGDQTQICMQTECRFTLPAGERSYVISKDGYYEMTGSLMVVRGQQMPINFGLEFIPQTLESTVYLLPALPAGYSKFSDELKKITLFNVLPKDLDLKKLPKIINNIKFSLSGKKALVFEDKKVSLYSAEDFSMKALDAIKDITNAVFSSNEENVYTILNDETAKKYALKKISLLQEQQTENLIYFLRDINQFELSVSPNEKNIMVLDKTFSPTVLYYIDLETKSRTNIFEGYGIELGLWSDDNNFFIFLGKTLDETNSALYYYDAGSKNVTKLTFKADILNFDFNTDAAYFITSEPYSLISSDLPYQIEFQTLVTTATYENMLNESIADKSLILAKWDLSKNAIYLIKDLSELINGPIEKVEISPDDANVRMLQQDKYYDIKIAE